VLDELVDTVQLVLDDVGALAGGGVIAAGDAAAQHLQVDDHGVQRILDLVREIIGETADELVAGSSQVHGRRRRRRFGFHDAGVRSAACAARAVAGVACTNYSPRHSSATSSQ
jgi:hypothetical protein